MRKLRALAAFLLAGGVTTGAVAWWRWPRPLYVVPVAPAGASVDLEGVVGDSVGRPEDCPRWVVVRRGHDAVCAVDAASGRSRGPWPVPPHARVEYDAAGRLLLLDRYEEERTFALLGRLDPETGEYAPFAPGPSALPFALVSADRRTLVTARGGRDAPLTVEVRSTDDFSVRAEWTFPDRVGTPDGTLDRTRKRVAAGAWGLAPDGSFLLLARPWDPAATETGVDRIDLSTGRVTHRFAIPRPPGRTGAPGIETIRVDLDGRRAWCWPVFWRPSADPLTGGAWTRTGGPPRVLDFDARTVTTVTPDESEDAQLGVARWPDGRTVRLVYDADCSPDLHRVETTDGAPVSAPFSLPPPPAGSRRDDAGPPRLAPGRPAVVMTDTSGVDPEQRSWVGQQTDRLFGPPGPSGRRRFHRFDVLTGDWHHVADWVEVEHYSE